MLFLNMRIGIITLIICLLSQVTFAQDFFEGQIDYKNTFISLHDNIDTAMLAKELGDSCTAYIKPDKYALIYNAKGSSGWMKVIVNLNEGFSYTEYQNNDTITKEDISVVKEKLLIFERDLEPKKDILGEECSSITMSYEPLNSEEFYTSITGTYHYNPKYSLDTELYKNNKSGFWNLYVNEAKAISLRNEIEFSPYFKSIQEAVSIVQQPIDESHFIVNTDKTITLKE